jgi:hypothetical protein
MPANQGSAPHDLAGLHKALQGALVDFNPNTRAPPYDARYLARMRHAHEAGKAFRATVSPTAFVFDT